MIDVSRRRGQPLIVLVLILGGWTAIRIIVWESPLARMPDSPLGAEPAAAFATNHLEAGGEINRPVRPASRRDDELASRAEASAARDFWLSPLIAANNRRLAGAASSSDSDLYLQSVPLEALRVKAPTMQPAVQQPLLPFAVVGDRDNSSDRRWSIDSWLLWREGSSALRQSATVQAASYGASQMGAVVRYRLEGKIAPFLYARASKALVNQGETDLAVGTGLNPIKGVPIALYAEARATELGGTWSLRPATFAVSELPPFKLTESTSVEVYAQAGYVGGRSATPFVDAQARLERRFGRTHGVELSMGGGTWGAAQDGASRLDIGPTVSARFEIGKVPVRLSADYRHRIAGDAEPGSGAAITISSGF